MAAFLNNLAITIGTVLGLVVLATLVEALVPRQRYSLRSRIPGTLFQVAQLSFSAFLAYPLGKGLLALGFQPILPPIREWAGPLAIPVALLFVDFLRYWEHRFEHRFMWNVHAVHHSARELHAANSYGHPLQVLPSFFLISLPFSLLHFDGAGTPLFVGLLISFMILFIHSPADVHLGPLRALLVDNRFHRIHHSLEERHFDRNFGIVFSIWDRLFGTAYHPAADEWPDVGVAGLPPPAGVGDFLLMPFRPTPPASADEALDADGAAPRTT